MALADHKPARKRGHLEHVITTLDAEGHHVVQWRNRNVKGANK